MGSDYFESLSEIQENLTSSKPHLGIGKDTVIRRAIVDKNVRIGKDVKLLNEAGIENGDAPDRSYFIRDGIIIVPKGATIPDGTTV
jgi:glucose-1-phosphate adenylyltransferase